MPTNTPRSIAEARPSDRAIAQACAEILGGGDDAIAIISRAREIDALATANGAERLPELPEAVPMGSDSDSVRDFTVYGYTADQMRAYALATRPQAASDGEDARILGLLAKRANFDDVSEGWVARTPLCEHRLDADQSRVWNAAIRAAAMTTDAAKGIFYEYNQDLHADKSTTD